MSDRRDSPPGAPPAAGRRLPEEEFESLLERALRIEVPTAETVPSASTGKRRWRPWRLTALAASVVLVVGVSIRLMQDYGYLSTGDLARDVVAHVHHERVRSEFGIRCAGGRSVFEELDVLHPELIELGDGAELEDERILVPPDGVLVAPYGGGEAAGVGVSGQMDIVVTIQRHGLPPV